jgi:hypothetical protein
LAGEWNAAAEGRELYDHEGDDGSDFDKYAHVNLAANTSYSEDLKRLEKAVRLQFDRPHGPL